MIRGSLLALLATGLVALHGCAERDRITELSQLAGKQFAVPTGTVADQLVLSRFPDAKFQYYNSVLDSAMAVRSGKADVAAYDEPILRNIAARNPGLRVLPEKITTDQYGFAVRLDDAALKQAIDDVVEQLRRDGTYDDMMRRWLPERGAPAAMPAIPTGTDGVLRFGTASVTEPFSFVDGSRQVVGIDIEIAARVAQKLNRRLEVVDMEFGAMIPALIAGKVDMIGACITITEERAQKVLFSAPYYTGGIAALVKGGE
jgi:polar amino acid transport system substrate-binding protein